MLGARGRRTLGRRTARAHGRGAQQAGTHCRRAARARGRQAHGARQALGARPAGRPGRDLGVAGPMGCALGALSLF